MAYLSRDYDVEGEVLSSLLVRNSTNDREVQTSVEKILSMVKEQGDKALFSYEKQFDGAELSSLEVTEAEFGQAETLVPEALKEALGEAFVNIRAFHQMQMPQDEHLEVACGVELSRKVVPLQRVGLYVPGGTAPLFSTVLMLAIPALVAGCKDVLLCTPPDSEGNVHPAILFTAKLVGVKRVFKLGGAQAIGALAYGSESVPKVDKIFGPGNRYVTAAKVQVSSECCAIDMPAGPSEVMVVATVDANPAFVASDLLSQAEHGKDSQAMLVIQAEKETGYRFLDQVEEQLSLQMQYLGRQQFLLSSLEHSHAIVCPTLEKVAFVVNSYAPEHLIINTTEPELLQNLVVNAGSLFIGPWSCETAGDYASGTNHTLPTNGWAHSYSGVSVDSFIKKMTIQKLSREGLKNLGRTLETMASQEQLMAHKNAVTIRLESKI